MTVTIKTSPYDFINGKTAMIFGLEERGLLCVHVAGHGHFVVARDEVE